MSFCPFLKDDCKRNECMLWCNENCAITLFFKGEPLEDESEEEGLISGSEDRPEPPEPSISKRAREYFKPISAEDIASECVEFIRSEFPDSDHRPYGVFDLFLQSKGLDRTYGIPLDINLKVTKARMLVEESDSNTTEEQIKKEKIELPTYIANFTSWMEDKKLEKVRLVDVDRFVSESELELAYDTIRSIYDSAQSIMEEKYKQRKLKERQEVPNLVDQCVDWARSNGLKTVSKSDIETFLLEKEYELTKETRQTVYALTNTKLKSKK